MNKKIYFLIFFITKLAYTEFLPGAKSISLGNIQSVLNKDLNAIFHNSAILNEIDKKSIFLSYSPIYGIENFYNAKIAVLYPFNNFKLSAGFYTIRLQNFYNYSKFLLSNAFQFKSFYFGLTLNYIFTSLSIENDEVKDVLSKKSAISFNIGILLKVNKNITIGVSGKNLNNPNLSFKRNSITKNDLREFRTGLRLNIFENFRILGEEEFRKGEKPKTSIGSELVFYNVIYARCGITDNLNLSTGFGAEFNLFEINFGILSNKELGNLWTIDFILKL